jgi:hypothetical protein
MEEPVTISLKQLAIKGDDVIGILVSQGVRPPSYRGGKDVGVLLERLLAGVIEDPRNGERETLLAKCAQLARTLGEEIPH